VTFSYLGQQLLY